MHKWIYSDGEFKSIESTTVALSNRSFNYGDGLFESIRIVNGFVLFFNDHCDRLFNGMRLYGFDARSIDAKKLKEIADELVYRNDATGGRLKIIVYRDSEGYYKPKHDEAKFIMFTEALESPEFTWNAKGLHTGSYTELLKPINFLSEIKSTSSILYILAAREARIKGWDEIFLFNEKGFLCEGSSSSVFLVDDHLTIHTPALNQGLLPGVMRKNLIRLMRVSGMQCVEREIAADELVNVREVFVTNATQGIRWVVSYRDKRYFNSVGKKVYSLLQNEVHNLLSI